MILLQSEDSILHLEFQTIPKENIPFRMLDYRVRGNRRYKGKPMRQVVIYLKPTTSVREALPLGNTRLSNQLRSGTYPPRI
jgi:predicted transposase YdaD